MRVLCADDEDDIRTILQLSLSLDPAIEAVVLPSGEALLAKVTEGGWDAVILDAMMPGLDGYETCRRLKADPATRHIPVVFLSAKTQRAEVSRALEVGAVASLEKPFDPLTLAGQLRAAIGA
jgi:CheY-like chemotaxis protein